MKKTHLVAFASGLVFAAGLGLGGMTQPAKVMDFLDVTGAWDPSLALVMLGAIAVHALVVWWGRRAERPLLADRFTLPSARGIDARLLAGAALFGLGWGAAGFCPGPALVSVVTLSPQALTVVLAMLGGMAVHAAVFERRPSRTALEEPAGQGAE